MPGQAFITRLLYNTIFTTPTCALYGMRCGAGSLHVAMVGMTCMVCWHLICSLCSYCCSVCLCVLPLQHITWWCQGCAISAFQGLVY
jgi:hypothetical protein